MRPPIDLPPTTSIPVGEMLRGDSLEHCAPRLFEQGRAIGRAPPLLGVEKVERHDLDACRGRIRRDGHHEAVALVGAGTVR